MDARTQAFVESKAAKEKIDAVLDSLGADNASVWPLLMEWRNAEVDYVTATPASRKV
jgi:hypothetical protein